MFDDLFSLEKERTSQQAFGFYLAYLLMAVLGGAILGGLAGVLGGNYESSARVGGVFAVLNCLGVSFGILNKKKLDSFGLIVVSLLSGLGAILGGGLLGLIPTAYLTTLKSESAPKHNEW